MPLGVRQRLWLRFSCGLRSRGLLDPGLASPFGALPLGFSSRFFPLGFLVRPFSLCAASLCGSSVRLFSLVFGAGFLLLGFQLCLRLRLSCFPHLDSPKGSSSFSPVHYFACSLGVGVVPHAFCRRSSLLFSVLCLFAPCCLRLHSLVFDVGFLRLVLQLCCCFRISYNSHLDPPSSSCSFPLVRYLACFFGVDLVLHPFCRRPQLLLPGLCLSSSCRLRLLPLACCVGSLRIELQLAESSFLWVYRCFSMLSASLCGGRLWVYSMYVSSSCQWFFGMCSCCFGVDAFGAVSLPICGRPTLLVSSF